LDGKEYKINPKKDQEKKQNWLRGIEGDWVNNLVFRGHHTDILDIGV
jgi:hypothetical protein